MMNKPTILPDTFSWIENKFTVKWNGNTDPKKVVHKVITIDEFVAGIKLSESLKSYTEKSRECLKTSKDDYNEMKDLAPAILPFGVYNHRIQDQDGKLNSLSGIIPLDLDALDKSKPINNLSKLRGLHKKCPYVLVESLSLSGVGLYIFMYASTNELVNIQNKEDGNHLYKSAVVALNRFYQDNGINLAKYNLKLDNKFFDLRYLAYDKDIYFNPKAIPVKVTKNIVNAKKSSGLIIKGNKTLEDLIEEVNRGDDDRPPHSWKDGDKHNFQMSLAGKGAFYQKDLYEFENDAWEWMVKHKTPEFKPTKKERDKWHDIVSEARQDARAKGILPIEEESIVSKEKEEANIEMFESLIITAEEKIPIPPTFMSYEGTEMLPAGAIMMLHGAQKTMKTTVFMEIVKAAAQPEITIASKLFGIWDVSPNSKGKAVIYIDTESSRLKIQERLIHIQQRYVYPVGMHSLTSKDRRELFADGVRRLGDRNKGIHLLGIDHIADFFDPNDFEASSDFISLLFNIGRDYGATLISTIHDNPNSDKARGHIGSELPRKAHLRLHITKKDGQDEAILSVKDVRDAPISEFPEVKISRDGIQGLGEVIKKPDRIPKHEERYDLLIIKMESGKDYNTAEIHKMLKEHEDKITHRTVEKTMRLIMDEKYNILTKSGPSNAPVFRKP